MRAMILTMLRRLFLVPPLKVVAAVVLALGVSGPVQAANIIDLAAESGTFNTFVAAVKASGLAETLNGPGPFTIFVPTDDAFAKLPRAQIEGLLKPENRDKLKQVLIHHVVAGRIMARDVLGKRLEAASVDGSLLLVDGNKGIVIEGAKVVKADVLADNGIMHVIDTVMMPK